MLPSGGVPRRARTAVAPTLLSSRAPSSAYAKETSNDELALRLGLDLRAPTRAAGSLAKKERIFARGVDSTLAPAPTECAFWTLASGLRILREGPTTGVLSRACSRSGAGGDGRRVCGALVRGRSGPSLCLARGAEGDRFTTTPTRHARGRSVAGSPAGSLMCASVYSATPTPVPGRRGTMHDAYGANEYGAARRGIHQNTRSHAHTADCATSYPASVPSVQSGPVFKPFGKTEDWTGGPVPTF
jgi:hypothetical protein